MVRGKDHRKGMAGGTVRPRATRGKRSAKKEERATRPRARVQKLVAMRTARKGKLSSAYSAAGTKTMVFAPTAIVVGGQRQKPLSRRHRGSKGRLNLLGEQGKWALV